MVFLVAPETSALQGKWPHAPCIPLRKDEQASASDDESDGSQGEIAYAFEPSDSMHAPLAVSDHDGVAPGGGEFTFPAS